MKKWILILTLMIMVVTLGCMTRYDNEQSGRFKKGHDAEGTKPALRITDPNFPETRARLNNVGILDDSLRYKIAIEGTGANRTATQTLQVWAQIRNRTDYPLQVECRTQWYDANQAPVDKPTAWERIALTPNSIETYRANSSNIYGITYYYIELREGR